jgi:two-component system sensor histidine kinase SenX3
VNPSWAVAIAAVAGLLAGLVAGVVAAGAHLGRGSGRGRFDEAGGIVGAGGLVVGPGRRAALPAGAGEVLNVLRSASVVLDARGALVKTSPAAYAFGLVRGRDLVHLELREMAAEARALGLVRERELELPRGPLGPGRFVVSARVAPLGDDLTLIMVEDRTEAHRVDEIRRDFVGNVSHELKTPIGALSLLAEAVHDAADDPEAVRHFAQRMQRESLRLSTLVQEIINLSRLQAADGLHAPQPVHVDEVVADAVDRHRLPAGARSIDIVIGGEKGAVVYGDHDLLVTAVRNLVDNAVAYSADGTRVSVVVRRVDGLAEIAVSDQGIGIAGTDQERIFERFYRVDPARSRATGGTGLGLSIVKHVAANHGGEVTLWSVPGQGSTFTLRLPESTPPGEPDPSGRLQDRDAGSGPHDLPDLPPDVLAGDDAVGTAGRPEPRGARA